MAASKGNNKDNNNSSKVELTQVADEEEEIVEAEVEVVDDFKVAEGAEDDSRALEEVVVMPMQPWRGVKSNPCIIYVRSLFAMEIVDLVIVVVTAMHW